MNEAVQLRQIQPFVFQFHGFHAATNVHTHQVGHDLVCNGHGRADGTACAGVHIGHDTDSAALGEWLLHQFLNLSRRSGFDGVGVQTTAVLYVPEISIIHVPPPAIRRRAFPYAFAFWSTFSYPERPALPDLPYPSRHAACGSVPFVFSC